MGRLDHGRDLARRARTAGVAIQAFLFPPAIPWSSSRLTSRDERSCLKNRLHLDFRPDDRDAAVARLLDLGAKPADVGQGEQSWVVLSDPEGNEFCVLSSRRPPDPDR